MTPAPAAEPTSPPPGTGAVRARCRIVAAPDGRGGTALPVIEGDGPLAPRRTRSARGQAWVTVVGAMSAPLGGDRLALDAEAEPGARLRIGSAAATVALPGRLAEPASYDIRLRVGRGAELHWLPEPLVSARGSDLRMTTRVELASDARLVLREEQVLGRAGEAPGRLAARLTVRRDGRPLLDQELRYGPGVPGWDGGAVLGGHRAAGQLLIAGPGLDAARTGPVRSLAPGAAAAVTPLAAGSALLVSAVARDALRLRSLLDETLAGVLGAAPDRTYAHAPGWTLPD